jgi:hypothetical protein
MRKWIVRTVLGIVVLAVLAVGIAWLMIDSLVKKGIQVGGQYALGVPTEVKDVRLSLLKGTLMIDTLKVSNPEGFKSPHVMQTGRFDLEVRPGSVLPGRPVDVRRFELDGLDINIEQLLKGNNISVVLDHVKKLTGGGSKDQPRDQGEGRKLLVDKLVIKNVVAHVHLPVPGAGKDLSVTLPAIELNDVTRDAPDGVTISGLVMRIVPAILAAVVEKGKGVIPADLSGILTGDVVATAQAMGGQASKLVEKMGGEAAATLKQGLDKAVKDVPKDVGGAIRGLLPKP